MTGPPKKADYTPPKPSKPKPKPKKAPKQEDPLAPDSEEQSSALDWASAVMWAAGHMSDARVSRRKVGALRYNIWEFGKENSKDLLVRMVPQALDLIEKSKAGDSEEMERTEALAIAEIDQLIKDAWEESASGQV